MLPNSIYLVRKIGTNKTQGLHRMRMRLRQFTPHQPPADSRVTPQEWKSDPEVSLKHVDLYARARRCDYAKPVFDAENNNPAQPNSPEIPKQSDLLTEETSNTPRTAQECSRVPFPQTEELCDVTGTYPDMETDVETNSEQSNNCPINPRSSKKNLRHIPKPNCNRDCRY